MIINKDENQRLTDCQVYVNGVFKKADINIH